MICTTRFNWVKNKDRINNERMHENSNRSRINLHLMEEAILNAICFPVVKVSGRQNNIFIN